MTGSRRLLCPASLASANGQVQAAAFAGTHRAETGKRTPVRGVARAVLGDDFAGRVWSYPS